MKVLYCTRPDGLLRSCLDNLTVSLARGYGIVAFTVSVPAYSI